MKVLAVQKFLETRTFGELYAEHGVNARVSSGGHKLSLNYDMIAWKPGDPLAEECRGLIVSVDSGVKIPVDKNNKPDADFCPGATTVQAFPLAKFYNSEEGHAAKVDWSDPKLTVFDKLDGTLIILYWDSVTEKWCSATRSVPDADLPIDGFADFTFSTLFKLGVKETLGIGFDEWTQDLIPSLTYCFELTSPRNRIMVEYPKTGITLIAARDKVTFQEIDINFVKDALAAMKNVPLPKTWNLSSYDEVREFVNSLSPTECEGGVVMDSHFRRQKIKSMKWIVANATKTSIGASPRNLVKYILRGIDDDVKSMLPEDLCSTIDEMKTQIFALFQKCDAEYAVWRQETETRKHFAEKVNLYSGWQGPFFKLYEGKVDSTWDFVQSLLKSDKLSDAFIDGILKHVKVRPHETFDQKVVSD